MAKYAKLLEMIGYHWLVTGGDRLQLKPVATGSKLQKKTSLHQFRAVAVAVMSTLGNKKLVRLLVALFGGKKSDRTGPENTSHRRGLVVVMVVMVVMAVIEQSVPL